MTKPTRNLTREQMREYQRMRRHRLKGYVVYPNRWDNTKLVESTYRQLLLKNPTALKRFETMKADFVL